MYNNNTATAAMVPDMANSTLSNITINCINITNSTPTTDNGNERITKAEEWFTIIFLSIVIVVTIIGNVIALHAFAISPELKKATYYFIATLCISDLMIAMFSIPFWVYVTADFTQYNKVPIFKDFIAILDIFCATWSITSLAMISIERFICISYALRYYYIMTNRRVVYMLVFIMFYATTTTVINHVQSYIKEENANAMFKVLQTMIILLAYVFPVMVKLFAYSRIFKVASKQAAEINKYNFNIAAKDREDEPRDSIVLIDTHRDKGSSTNNKTSLSNSNGRSWGSPILRCRNEKSDKKKGKGKINKQRANNYIHASYDHHNQNGDGSTISLNAKLRKCLKCKSYFQNDDNKSFDKNNKNGFNGNDKSTTYTEDRSFQRQDSSKSYSNMSEKGSPIAIPKTPKTSLDVKYHQQQQQHQQQNGTSSPIVKSLRGTSSNWSPSNSPLLFHKKNQQNSSRSSSSTTTSNKHKRQEQKVRRFKKELRAAKVVGFIIGTFLFCWTPFMILMVLYLAGSTVSPRAVAYAKNLHYLNSAINPVLYVVLNKVYRRAVHKSLNKIKSKLFCS